MTWGHQYIELECGCDGAGPWHETWVGQAQVCSQHGETSVVRMSQVLEASGSRDAKLRDFTSED